MYAKVTSLQVKPGKIDDFIKIYNETQKSVNQQGQGFQSARLLTDTSTNRVVTVTIWATESDAKASVTPSTTENENLRVRFEEVVEGPAIREYYVVSSDY